MIHDWSYYVVQDTFIGSDIPAGNLYTNDALHASLKERMNLLLQKDKIIDCCLKSYRHIDKPEVVKYRMFDTKLLK
eukprot:m.246443 g.246443  ORF g.246443 m.246443 type:complete len:76 (+) comp16116_c0_seq47:1909-2136(+)